MFSHRESALTRVVGAVLGVLMLVALAFAGYYASSWWNAAHDDAVSAAKSRDAAVRDAAQIAVNLTTLRQASAEADLQRWQESSTGPQLDAMRQQHQQTLQFLRQSKTSSVGAVKDAALTAFDPGAGTASALVAVDVTVTVDKQAPNVVRQMYQLALQHTDAGWKATNAGPVRDQPVTDSGKPGAPAGTQQPSGGG